MLRHGGSQPRNDEGASHFARRGKNAEAFLIAYDICCIEKTNLGGSLFMVIDILQYGQRIAMRSLTL